MMPGVCTQADWPFTMFGSAGFTEADAVMGVRAEVCADFDDALVHWIHQTQPDFVMGSRRLLPCECLVCCLLCCLPCCLPTVLPAAADTPLMDEEQAALALQAHNVVDGELCCCAACRCAACRCAAVVSPAGWPPLPVAEPQEPPVADAAAAIPSPVSDAPTDATGDAPADAPDGEFDELMRVFDGCADDEFAGE